jgi:carboxyl-terminal processing protease
MGRKDFSRTSAALFGALLVVLVVSNSVLGQSPAPGSSVAQIDDLLRQGYQLEQQKRWSEALTLYEDGVRQFPAEQNLQRRFEFTRLHYDVGRRLNDTSFRAALTRLSLNETLDLYSEVLLKIQTHYVEGPNFKELVERGTNALEVALAEPTFLERCRVSADPQVIEGFRQELRRTLGPRMVQSRNDARNLVSLVSAMAADRLGVPQNAVVMEYTCGAANALDVYSSYLTPGQLTDVYSQIEGNFVGLGIELKADNGSLLLVRVINGSPAQKGGLRDGDRILAVDGHQTRDYSTDQAANLLQGEVGSLAELVVQSPGQSPRTVQIHRERVEVPSIDEAHIVDTAQGIGYLKLTCFQKTTSRDLDVALWNLHREGMRSLIMDLRGNPGGLLITAVEVADKFVERGVIVSTRGRNAQEDFTYSAHEAGTWRVPLVVMIDQDSASAAEIFAGAMRDHRRATIVGVRSYGKGSVQGIFPLSFSNAGLRLTTAKFYSPKGYPYSGIGVEPDLAVHKVARPSGVPSSSLSGDSDDPALTAAIEVARQRVAQR